MKCKMRWWKKVLLVTATLILLVIIIAIVMFWRVIRTAASVEEAVELLSGYDLHASAGMMVHFSIEDASGRSVAVEYIDNEIHVVETDIATNFYLSEGEKYGIGSEESHIRYEILDALLQERKVFTMEDIRDALSSVSKHNFDSPFASTQCSTSRRERFCITTEKIMIPVTFFGWRGNKG